MIDHNLIDRVFELLGEYMGPEFIADMDEEMLVQMALKHYQLFLEEKLKEK
jgi:hypothetical protein